MLNNKQLMRMKFSYIILVIAACLLLTETSCKKERILNSGGDLRYSTDTLSFDTVFTTQGSFTASFKIYNPQPQRIKVSSVRLAGGQASYFSLNVDGYKGQSVENIEIAPNDSIFVFATVNIDPTSANTPFVVEDKVVATMNGNDYELPLVAYGQNAYYLYDSIMPTQTWLTDKPYVVINSALVDSLQTLTIPAGCKIYMHANSTLYVKGTLKINGTKADSVVFQGDRLDRAYFGYEGYPGEWGGIFFLPGSTGSVLDYAVLRNCGNGSAGVPAALYAAGGASLQLKHVTVENSIGYGLICFGAQVRAENSLFHTCGAQALAIFEGGQYDFLNCNFINFGTDKVSHIDNPTVAVLNYRKVSETEYVVGNLLPSSFVNCVIWGSLENEMVLDKLDAAGYDLTLEHCLIKKKISEDPIPGYVSQQGNIINQDPIFSDQAKWNYRLQANSPLINTGKTITISKDLDDNVWVPPFDIGCYQF
jgi:hypothetical protein